MDKVVFFVAGAIVLVGAASVVMARNPVHSALALVGTLFGVAVLFVEQEAHFLAAVQVIVYAGAIVVLFLFVIMLLGVDRSESLHDPLPYQRVTAFALGAIVLAEILFLSAHQWATGQTAESDYESGGGIVSVALCYPGSLMTLSVTDPRGAVHASRQSGSPVVGHIDGEPGLWRAIVRAVDVPGGEPWAVAWATNAVCGGEKVDTGTNIREILSNAKLSSGLADSGAAGINIQVQGVSSNSARIYYYSNIGGVELSWTIDFYAATPNLGAVLTQITIKGINVTTQVVSRLTASGASISSIPTDYIVDRVYSCVGPEGNAMVIEGHR